MNTLQSLATDLAAGRTTSRALVEDAIARIDDAAGEGARVFTRVDRAAARAAAVVADGLRKAGVVPSLLAGLPISVKDLFDVRGEVTTAGSVVLKDAPPASMDAVIVARLRAAGAVILGRTNMTEFAYSGVGLNPHYGTPKSPWDRKTGRIPGGSSAGAGVSVADRMSVASIGTDTGGSVRIPAALNGIVGFKPTARRIPLAGCFPLSASLDSIGPLALSVACCALVDAAMAGAVIAPPEEIPLSGLRFAVAKTIVQDEMDRHVADAFAQALSRLSAAGARIVDIPFAELAEIPKINTKGGIIGAESYAVHRERLASAGDRFDPRVRVRIQRGAQIAAADYIETVRARAALIARANGATAPFDAVLMPTVPEIAPPIADLAASDEIYAKKNVLMLRNPTMANFLDRCALSIPCHRPGEAPVGLTVMGEIGADQRLLAMGRAIETTLRAG